MDCYAIRTGRRNILGESCEHSSTIDMVIYVNNIHKTPESDSHYAFRYGK